MAKPEDEPAVWVYDLGDGEVDIVLSEAMHALPDGARALRLAQLSEHFIAKAAELASVDVTDGAPRH